MKLSLEKEDADTIERFRVFVGSSNKVTSYDNVVETRLSSTEMAMDLLNWGVQPQKSLTARAHEMLVNSRHFWRGAFDGDGTVKCYTRPRLSLCGASRYFLQQFVDYMKRSTPEAVHDYYNIRPRPDGSRTMDIGFSGLLAKQVLCHLYQPGDPAMPRKMQVVDGLRDWSPAHKHEFHLHSFTRPNND